MQQTATRIPYRQTNAFSRIITDYLDNTPALAPFYAHPPTPEGIGEAIAERKKFNTPRTVLVTTLQKQYADVVTTTATANNIAALAKENTFTITTAHQNNIFTGPLYFIYKIIHAIRLADDLNHQFPDCHFVPVYYIGSEDADFAELNHIYLGGEKLEWTTNQRGAVGRMKIDRALVSLIDRIAGQLNVLPFGKEWEEQLRRCYREGVTVQEATFQLVHSLFGKDGLIVLLPDQASLKGQVRNVFADDLFRQVPSQIVEQSTDALHKAGYKVQAHPRDINLFYLDEGIRERFILDGDHYEVNGTSLRFSKKELEALLASNPERFSPNVILRGLYQEVILPNIIFIGGGGETAYWLQLKTLFDHYEVPFPVLVLRNSFLLLEKKEKQLLHKLGLTIADLFSPEETLMTKIVRRDNPDAIQLSGSMQELKQLYGKLHEQAIAVDPTLDKHVLAIHKKAADHLQALEKKMVRAAKRKFTDQRRQLHSLQSKLFPGNGLQERRENIGYYYARWGSGILRLLYDHSLTLEQEFTILELE